MSSNPRLFTTRQRGVGKEYATEISLRDLYVGLLTHALLSRGVDTEAHTWITEQVNTLVDKLLLERERRINAQV